ncbi:hypothetical protein [Methylomonas sp. AM2-LC]|uniref:hypothetical protein n=1 Tax=Methylomonas sp. AM2-LC TaxID=3153301 RepID=UPI003265A318
MKFIQLVVLILVTTNNLALAGQALPQRTVNNEDFTVEKNGIVFEIVLPYTDWVIPENKPGNSTALLDVKLRITNTTNKPLRFNGFNSLFPELVTSDGKHLHCWQAPDETLRHRQAQDSDYPLIEHGNSITLPLLVDLFWPNLEPSTLTFRWWLSSGEPGQYFDDLKPGNYLLRLVYQNSLSNLESELPSHKIFNDNVWKGEASTPYVPILLRYSTH